MLDSCLCFERKHVMKVKIKEMSFLYKLHNIKLILNTMCVKVTCTRDCRMRPAPRRYKDPGLRGWILVRGHSTRTSSNFVPYLYFYIFPLTYCFAIAAVFAYLVAKRFCAVTIFRILFNTMFSKHRRL